MEPNLDEGDLTYLNEFRAACPNVDVYIFHRWDEAKYGVQVTGDVDNWENEFPSLSECEFEPPQVIVDDLLIKGNIHVAAERFEAFKTVNIADLLKRYRRRLQLGELIETETAFLCATTWTNSTLPAAGKPNVRSSRTYRTPADVRLLMASVMEKVCERKPGATWSSSTAELEKSLSSVRPHRHQNV